MEGFKKKLENAEEVLTFDDVLLKPAASKINPANEQVDLSTKISRNHELNIPMISAAMDTVTGVEMAREMAFHGGLGVLHSNMEREEMLNKVEKLKSMDLDKLSRDKDSLTEPAKDSQGNLLCGVAFHPFDKDYAIKADEKGADILFIDSSHAHNLNVVEAASEIREKIDADLVAGNIATEEAVEAYGNDIDGLKVGIGPGSICTTRIITGVGIPQLNAISEVADASSQDIPVIADGGIRFSGDIAKSISVGANLIMAGSLFAGTDESIGKIRERNGSKVKEYRGMGSQAVKDDMSKRYLDRINTTPEGVESSVKYTGSLRKKLQQLLGGLKSSMGYTGTENMREMKKETELVRISEAGKRESHPHSIKNIHSPNY